MSTPREELAADRRRLAHEVPRLRVAARKHKTLSGRVKRLRSRIKRRRGAIMDARRPIGVRALSAAATQLGKTETSGPNDAPWLRTMEAELVRAGSSLSWMIPGNPYCGMGVLWSWLKAGLKLPDNWVGTTNILAAAGQVITANDGRRYKLVRVAPEQAKPGAIVVFDFVPGTGADHTGLARGPLRSGEMPTREFNTSPGNSGSQANGGGVFDRTRPRGLILGVLDVVPA